MTSASTLTTPRRYRLTVDAYDRMTDAGVFPPDARIELLEGVLYEMPPMGQPHQGCVALQQRSRASSGPKDQGLARAWP